MGGEEKTSTKQGQTAAVLEVVSEVKCIIARRRVVERQELIKPKQKFDMDLRLKNVLYP